MRVTSYHPDVRGPAVNVKCYDLARDVPANSTATEDQRERAWEDMGRTWWADAGAIAQRHGFEGVGCAGRMGGWLCTQPLPAREAEQDHGEYPAAFLAEIDQLLKDAPRMYAELLAGIVETDAAAEREAAEREAARAAEQRRLTQAACIASRLAEVLRRCQDRLHVVIECDTDDAEQGASTDDVEAWNAAREVLAEFDALEPVTA